MLLPLPVTFTISPLVSSEQLDIILHLFPTSFLLLPHPEPPQPFLTLVTFVWQPHRLLFYNSFPAPWFVHLLPFPLSPLPIISLLSSSSSTCSLPHFTFPCLLYLFFPLSYPSHILGITDFPSSTRRWMVRRVGSGPASSCRLVFSRGSACVKANKTDSPWQCE